MVAVPGTSAPGKPRQNRCELEDSLGYTLSHETGPSARTTANTNGSLATLLSQLMRWHSTPQCPLVCMKATGMPQRKETVWDTGRNGYAGVAWWCVCTGL